MTSKKRGALWTVRDSLAQGSCPGHAPFASFAPFAVENDLHPLNGMNLCGWRSLFLPVLLALALGAAAQRVTNVAAEQQGQALLITYALDADGPVAVDLFLSTDRGGTWQNAPKGCTGDLGKNVAPGTAKRIQWDVLQDRELVGDGIRFKVVATNSGAAGKPWLNPALTYGSVKDIDGNTYATIRIGGQEWMAENLRTSRYRDGTPIPNVTDGKAWSRLTTGAWCNYGNKASHDASYGKLYNWYAVADRRGLCPRGWHVPSNAEWNRLGDYLGGRHVAGREMKAILLWTDTSIGATNASGFSGLPSGGFHFMDDVGWYIDEYLGMDGCWWEATETGQDNPTRWDLTYNQDALMWVGATQRDGFCVRCLRD